MADGNNQFEQGASKPRGRAGRLDGWPARLVALLVLAACAAVLVRLHWDDLFPSEEVGRLSDDPAAACIASRHGDIEGMLHDGVIDRTQEAVFKARAEAFCRAQVAKTGAPNAGQGSAPVPAQ